MSLGAFMEGLSNGYLTVEGIQERKDRRKRRVIDEQWTDDARQRQRDEWARQDKERSVMAAIAAEARAGYDAQDTLPRSEGQPTPERAAAPSDASEEPVVARLSTRNVPADAATPTQDAPEQPTANTSATAVPRAPSASLPPARMSRPGRTISGAMQDQAVERPEAAPVQVAPQREEMARRNGLSAQAIATARAVDIAAMEAQTGRAADTGRALSEEEVSARIAQVEHADGQLATLVQRAQPYTKPPAPPAPGFGGQVTPGSIVESWKRHGATVAHALTPATQQQADMGPDRAGADAAAAQTNAAYQAQGQANDPSPAPRPPSPAASPAPRSVSSALAAAPERDAAPVVDARPSGPAQMAHPARVAAPQIPANTPPTKVAGELASEVSAAPPDQGGAPSVELAVATAPAPRRVVGKGGPIKATPQQRERASQSFLDYYADTAVPKIIEYYLSQGDIQKAEGFETWAKSREAQAQLKSWSMAVHAASIGDDEGFIDHWSDAYNSFDDGLEVARDQSGFTRDEGGNITGAKVTFKNTQSGQTFERVFEGQEDLIREGIYTLAPEKVFEYMWGEISAANSTAASDLEFKRKVLLEQVKAGVKSPEKDEAKIAAAKKFLAENMQFGEWDKLTPEEQNQKAIDYVRQNQAAGAELGRPAAPPLYTGD